MTRVYRRRWDERWCERQTHELTNLEKYSATKPSAVTFAGGLPEHGLAGPFKLFGIQAQYTEKKGSHLLRQHERGLGRAGTHRLELR